jgi:hypothetical protein
LKLSLFIHSHTICTPTTRTRKNTQAHLRRPWFMPWTMDPLDCRFEQKASLKNLCSRSWITVLRSWTFTNKCFSSLHTTPLRHIWGHISHASMDPLQKHC